MARARDLWLETHEGKTCCKNWSSGIYLRNRLEKVAKN